MTPRLNAWGPDPPSPVLFAFPRLALGSSPGNAEEQVPTVDSFLAKWAVLWGSLHWLLPWHLRGMHSCSIDMIGGHD
jgi:hypothetical protein